ncbi:MAG: TetR/AcrR family transcriptional regulator [Gammaproteobacteria bacterium]|nr:TetR/AcrR family transcriptional regulator [Gammaproteobacteria bacterium]
MPNATAQSKQAVRGQYARSEDTCARILDAALVEARKSGFHNTSVAKIAARAGVAVGILNYHFGSKQELLRELMATQAGEFISKMTPPRADETFFDYEQRLLTIYVTFLHENPNYVRLAEEVRLHAPKLYQEGVKANVSHICGRIRRGIDRDELRRMDDAAMRANAFFMLGAMTFFDRYIEDDHYPGDAAAVTAFINSLRGAMAS